MEWDWIQKAFELKSKGEVFVLATVIGEKGSTPRDSGAKMIVTPKNDIYGTIGGGQLEQAVREDALQFLINASKSTNQYALCLRARQCCGGAAEVFFEIIGMQPKLYVFGAGHVGQALAQTLDGTPFDVHLIDSRSEWLGRDELPKSTRTHLGHWQQVLSDQWFHRRQSYFLVMTHDHQMDLEIVGKLIQHPARWIGLIGSAHKRDRFIQSLKKLGRPEDEIQRIHCPIGEDRIGKAPKEVAISVAAQLLKVFYES